MTETKAEKFPYTRNPEPIRIWGIAWTELNDTARGVGTARATIAGDAAGSLNNWLLCEKCKQPVPLIWGDLTGTDLAHALQEATKARLRQKCNEGHSPVLVGAETASAVPVSAGTAGEAATREGDAGERTERPAPAPAKTRKTSRKRAEAVEHVVPVAAESTPAATAARLAAEVPGVGLASELPSPRPGTLAFKPPVDEPHLPPVHEVPAVPQRAKQGLTTAHAVTCKCGICKPAKGSRR